MKIAEMIAKYGAYEYAEMYHAEHRDAPHCSTHARWSVSRVRMRMAIGTSLAGDPGKLEQRVEDSRGHGMFTQGLPRTTHGRLRVAHEKTCSTHVRCDCAEKL